MKTLDSITYYACRILPVVIILSLLVSCFTGCETMRRDATAYESTVAERDDSISGYEKGDSAGGAYTHKVFYKQ